MSSNTLVEAVKKHALANYEGKYGWSEIVECWSDEDLATAIAGATTEAGAIDIMSQYVDLKEERYREAVGPDVKCPTCGTVFAENTCCPKCR